MKRMSLPQIISRLEELSDNQALNSMGRFGIETSNALGIKIPELRKIAKETGKDHTLALELWNAGVHEARILATMVDEQDKVTEEQLDSWAIDLYSWDLCDHLCGNLIVETKYSHEKLKEWVSSDLEFVKRAGFVIMASIASNKKHIPNSTFIEYLAMIRRESDDDRNFVKKAINWALRQIGKRNQDLNREAIIIAQQMIESDSKASRWIAKNALHELMSERVQRMLVMNRSRK